MKPIYMVDASAPFFVRHRKELEKDREKSINWSKAPTHAMMHNGRVKRKAHKKVRESFSVYVKRVARLGYNAVSIDEAAYLMYPENPDELLRKNIDKYRKYYRRLFRIALDQGLTPYITADIWYSSHIPHGGAAGRDGHKLYLHIAQCLDSLLEDFPELGGIIIRIGESDGVDVNSPFRSRLAVKKEKQLRSLLEALVPIFENKKRMLILRTWTLGAGSVGDLLWNRKTLMKCLPGSALGSPCFLLSYKYSASDFIRYQKLNPYALNSPAPFLLELQARREYEGFGEFPCFVGFDYARYADQLRNNPQLRGIHVWCQTGGWSRFRNFSFMKRGSYWNELNTAVSLLVFKNQGNLYRALEKSGFQGKDLGRMLRFLELSDELIKNVLYIPGFARKTLFLNRSRIPALIHVLWDRITVTSLLSELVLRYSNPEADWQASKTALDGLSEMQTLGRKLGLDYDARFHKDTMELFHLAAGALLFPDSSQLRQDLANKCDYYEKKYPDSYRTRIRMDRSPVSRLPVRWLFSLLIREREAYRIRDRVLFSVMGPVVVHLILPLFRRYLPETLDHQSMPLKDLIG